MRPLVIVAAAAVVLAVLGLPRLVRAADYWVKNGGNDALDGLSQVTAWATRRVS
jgi:hypothetical protein